MFDAILITSQSSIVSPFVSLLLGNLDSVTGSMFGSLVDSGGRYEGETAAAAVAAPTTTVTSTATTTVLGTGTAVSIPAEEMEDDLGEPSMVDRPLNLETSIPAGASPPPTLRSLHSLGVSEDLWRYYRDVAYESQREMRPSDSRHNAVPPPFCQAYALDLSKARSSFGYEIVAYKVVNRDDGLLYCLRRADNVRSVSHKIATTVTERWNTATTPAGTALLDHPGIVRFYKVFLQNRAVFFLHSFVPGARTMQERMAGVALPEPLLWSCVTQLAAALRAIHGANLACRTLQMRHVLCTNPPDGTGRIRLKINCVGMIDALEFESRKVLADLQEEDLRDLGRIVMSLATGTEVTRSTDPNDIRRCDMFVAQNYSRPLHNLVVQLLLPTSKPPPIFDVCTSIAPRAFDELDWQQSALDTTESVLSAEFDSARPLRLLLKMAFVHDRPELGMNRRWTESGDCYILKLFRDYGES